MSSLQSLPFTQQFPALFSILSPYREHYFKLYSLFVKCLSCNIRKGRRECPALGGMICSQCCGSKRGVEIRCPDDCQYFGEAMGRKWFDLFYPAWAEIKGEEERKALFDSVQICFPLVIFLQRRLLEILFELSEREDDTVLESLQLLRDGYQAVSKGIIYEPSSTNPAVKTILREMRELVKQEENSSPIPPDFLTESLRIMILFMEHYISRTKEKDSFFQLLRTFHPTVEAREEPIGGIIITR